MSSPLGQRTNSNLAYHELQVGIDGRDARVSHLTTHRHASPPIAYGGDDLSDVFGGRRGRQGWKHHAHEDVKRRVLNIFLREKCVLMLSFTNLIALEANAIARITDLGAGLSSS